MLCSSKTYSEKLQEKVGSFGFKGVDSIGNIEV